MPRARIAFLLVLFVASVAAAKMATVHGVSRIYLRTGPGTSHEPDGVVVEGEPLEAIEPSGSWMKVQTADGRTGYVYASYLRYGAAPSAAVQAEPAAEVAQPAASAEQPQAAADPAAPEPLAPAAGTTTETTLAVEVAELRSELDRLRSEVREAPADGGPAASEKPPPGHADVAGLTLPTRGPIALAPETVDGASLRTAGVALFFLVVGWVFGAGFSRRRSRSPRGRLRF